LARFVALGSAFEEHKAMARGLLLPHPALAREAVEALLVEPRSPTGLPAIQESLLKLWMQLGPKDVPPPALDGAITQATEVFAWGGLDEGGALALRALPLERREGVLLGAQHLAWPLLFLAPTPAVMDRALEALAQMSSPAFPGLIEDGLVGLGAELVPRVVAMRARLRHQGAVLIPALRRLGDPRGALVLASMLGDGREALRRAAVEVLSALGPSEPACEALREALADKKPRVREAAAQAVLGWGERDEVEALLSPLRGSEKDKAVLALLDARPKARSPWEARWREVALLRGAPLPEAQEKAWRAAFGSAWGARWSDFVDAGLPFLVFVSHGLDNKFYANGDALAGAWYELLRRLAAEPLALVLALERLRGRMFDSPSEYVSFLVDNFGDALEEPAVYLLLHRAPVAARKELYEWLCGRPSSEGEARALHLVTLEDDSEWMREQAARVVSSWGAGCLPEVLPKLGSSKAAVRHSAATVLRRLGSQEALPAIQAALAKEKSQKVVAELEAARAECDPFSRAMRVRAASLGAYRFGEPFDVNEALTELRGVLYIDVANPASWERWLRLWDLLERFGEAGCLPMALDYAKGNGVEAWPAEHRKALWGAAGLPGVSPLVTGVAGPGVISVARFAQPAARAAFFKERLPMEERGVRARRFVPDDAGIFLRCVEVGWAWCERQGIPLDHLDVRVDGGTVREKYAGGADSTAIELRGGFAVELFRDSARREGDLRNGVRWLRARVPKNHPLRAERGMTPRDRFLDLRGELGAEIGPGLV
jgi:HEAT repeat protein